MKLNLTAHNPAEEAIKAYLEQNASQALAEKINNGTPITKDGKQLVNRKTLDGFMKYAETEARKLAEKGAHFACVDHNTVFGWVIHYFEEEAIEGEIFNLDSTPYKKPTPTAEKKAPAPKTAKPGTKAEPKPTPKAEPKKATILPTPTPKPEQKPTKKTNTEQISIFDLF